MRRFIGREAELDTLRTLLGRATAAETQFALVSGPAGVGKSSLLNEFVGAVDGRVLVGSCLPLGERGVPFAPVVEMLRTLESDPVHRDLLPPGLIGPLTPALTAAPEPATRTHLFQALLDLITRLAETAPTVIVIEDLHWADRSTRDLFAFLLPNLRNERLLLLISYRTDDVHRDHPLRPMLAELQRNARVERIEVEPFSSALVARQIENLTGQMPSARTLSDVMKRTQGNPYFIEQLIAADGAYEVAGRTLPASLRELLLVRADVVSSAARRTLRILSVAEDDVADESLARVAALSVADVRDHIREAIDTRLLVATTSGTRFAHALLREALHHDLLPGERAEFHAAFADVIASDLDISSGNRAGRLAQLAHHRAGAGDTDRALEAWSGAASAAEAIFAFAEAHHHLSQIIANWDRATDPADRVGADYVDVVGRAAELAFLGGDAPEATRLARTAISLVDAETQPHAAGVLYERLARYVRDTVEHDQALGLVERALELVPSAPESVDHARVLAGVAGQLMTHGKYSEARTFARRAADEARAVGSILAEADALNTLGVLATVIDDVERGVATIARALTLAERCGDAHQQMRSYWNTVACLSDAGEWERALRAFEEAIEHLPRLGQGHLLPELYVNAADILMVLGRWDEAEAIVDEANRRFADTDGAVLTDIVTERGNFEQARRLIESKTARNLFTDQEQQGWPLVHLASLETWEGHHEAARRAVDSALAVTADLDVPIATAYALSIGCRCEGDAAERARRHGAAASDEDVAATRCDAHVRQLDAMLARPGPTNGWKREVGALATQCRAELTRARGQADPSAWAEATQGWERMKMPYHAAYTRFRHAEALFGAAGDRSEIEGLLVAAHTVTTSLGAEPLRTLIERFARRARLDIGLAGPAPDDLGLTAREREVLATLSTGATNRQIASTLFISEKTASVHVSNIIRKLGVSNRGQAAAVAHREGIVV